MISVYDPNYLSEEHIEKSITYMDIMSIDVHSSLIFWQNSSFEEWSRTASENWAMLSLRRRL